MSETQASYDGGRWYVYALIDPFQFRQTRSQLLSVLYVGKGIKERVHDHERDERRDLEKGLATIPMSSSKSERIRSLLGSGEPIPSVTLASGLETSRDAELTESLAMELIGRLLAAYGMERLGNIRPGRGQTRGLKVHGLPAIAPEPRRPPLPLDAVADEPQFEFRSVKDALDASTSRRVDWRTSGVIEHPTVLVKGNADLMPGGSHLALPVGTGLPPGLLDLAERITSRDGAYAPGTEFERRGYDPDDPWSDHEARERATRYWPFAAAVVQQWLTDEQTRPVDLLLAVPGTGGTTVRYAWQIDYDEPFEHFANDHRWGIPLGRALPSHPARGLCLVEDRGERTGVQVLLNHTSGCRVLEP